MDRTRWRLMGIVAAVLLLAAVSPLAAETAETPATAPAGETISPAQPAEESESCWSDENPAAQEVGLIIVGGCLGTSVLTCDDLPSTVNSTCSCTSQVLGKECKKCDVREKGVVVETTCTVCPGCTGPLCIPQPCWDRTSQSCQ